MAKDTARSITRLSPAPGSEAYRWLRAAVFVLLAGFWVGSGTGIVSSNDGSHLALARALALYREVHIDPEAALTLRVDLAQRRGHFYSDRPPGTAFLALPAVLIGHGFDGRLLRGSRRRNEMMTPTASAPFERTYYHRGHRPPLLVLMLGSILAACLQSVAMGLVALACLWHLLERRGVDLWGCIFAVLALGLGSLLGPYSTALFSHSTAAALVAIVLVAIDHLNGDVSRRGPGLRRPEVLWTLLLGLAGGWASATDYLLVVVMVPLTMSSVRWRRWWLLWLGALPIVVATLIYHDLAFGSPFSLGYDHHANFKFARDRWTTFDGSLLTGFWVQWGLGKSAGLLAQSPIAFLGLCGTIASCFVGGRSKRPRGAVRLAMWLPWILLLCLHRTPEGGQGVDHRYLIPIMPVAGLGLGALWTFCSGRRWLQSTLVGLAGGSAMLVWPSFLAWHETDFFSNAKIGLIAAMVLSALIVVPRILEYGFGSDEDPSRGSA